jgi:hypothetical protein
MTDQHPITPPPELVQQWWSKCSATSLNDLIEQFATKAARWGADQELEACCVEVEWLESSETAKRMRERRRPKPPSLKEQALDALREAESTGCLYVNGRSDLIRKALEALPND